MLGKQSCSSVHLSIFILKDGRFEFDDRLKVSRLERIGETLTGLERQLQEGSEAARRSPRRKRTSEVETSILS
ncbi:hypothetical protein [Niallia sp. NCCP-28]|uniref:hypothetical protein n=1 Tax=Niallia sp. NCCP-28 TaxID=2934712 RepID=UPI0020C10370|nr:hypothetical protein [Niallia sp. NCCP-28]